MNGDVLLDRAEGVPVNKVTGKDCDISCFSSRNDLKIPSLCFGDLSVARRSSGN